MRVVRLSKSAGSSDACLRVTIPKELITHYRLKVGDFMLIESDAAGGFIKLIPAKVVPARGPAGE